MLINELNVIAFLRNAFLIHNSLQLKLCKINKTVVDLS